MNKKGILMISSTSLKGGGPEHMFSLGNHLINDFRVYFAMPFSNKYRKFLNKNNFIKIAERKLSFLDFIRLIKFIKSNSITIIHAHGKGAGLIGRILSIFVNIPIIYTFHGIHISFYSKFLKKIYCIYENLFGNIDSLKIFVSKSEKEIANQFFGIKNQNSLIINNAVLNRKILKTNLDQEKINKSINIFNNSVNIISMCRLVIQKNIYEILNIAKNLPEYNFIILGNGPLMNDLKDYLIEEKIVNIFMFGDCDNVFKYLYASKLYLSTSIYEGLSISILEAMSLGMPILASKVVGNIDAVIHGISGYLYELGDIESAKKYIKKILKDEKLYEYLSYSSQYIQRKNFSFDTMVSKYKQVYNNY